MDSIPNRNIKVVMGDFNAKVGQGSTNVACGNFGLGEQNIRSEDLLEFRSSNNLTIANTLFQKHPRHSTFGSHQTIEPEIRLITSYSAKNGKATLKMSEKGQGQTAIAITNSSWWKPDFDSKRWSIRCLPLD